MKVFYPINLEERKFFVRRAEIWTRVQAKRLGYSGDEILDAVRRGWLAEDIEALATTDADKLRLSPAKANPPSRSPKPATEDRVRPWRPRKGSLALDNGSLAA